MTADLTTTSDPARATRLLALLDDEAEQHALWSESDEPYPDADYWEALEEMIDEWGGREIPADLAHVAPAIDHLADEYERFNSTGAALPGASFWRARTAVHTARERKPPTLAPLATPAELVAQGVFHRQIARIWKLVDDRDTPLVDLVQQELDHPGSVLTAEYVAEVNARRLVEAGFGAATVSRERPQVLVPQRAASLEELIFQRAPLTQIVAVKSQQYSTDFPPAVVMSLAAAMGVKDLPGSAAAVLNAAGAADIARESAGTIGKVPLNTVAVLEEGREIVSDIPAASASPAGEDGDMSEEQSIEDQVIDLFTAGHDSKAIAQHVSLPKKKVDQIIREFSGEPAVKESTANA